MGNRITALYVHPQFTRRGISTHLLRKVERIAIVHNMRMLRVAASLTAQPFYQANGYRVQDESDLIAAPGLSIPYINMTKYLLPGLSLIKP